VTVLATQEEIDQIGERIEKAYFLRRPRWEWTGSGSRVWSIAAARLLQTHQEDPMIPVDPEFYVAVQPIDARRADPWTELTQATAAQRFRRHVRRIIRALRCELRLEVRLAERRIRCGMTLESVVSSKSRLLSPLGCFIVAYRAGRDDLAERFRSEAEAQHCSCPL